MSRLEALAVEIDVILAALKPNMYYAKDRRDDRSFEQQLRDAGLKPGGPRS